MWNKSTHMNISRDALRDFAGQLEDFHSANELKTDWNFLRQQYYVHFLFWLKEQLLSGGKGGHVLRRGLVY